VPAQEQRSSTPRQDRQTEAQDNPLSGYTKSFYGDMKAVLLASAEKMPEVSYNFNA
jgi:hypothetical protein